MPVQPVQLRSEPGIKRDGTRFEGDFYVDGQWVRFQRGLPRKIGGYRSTVKTLGGTSRGFVNFPQDDFVYCHSGSTGLLERFVLDSGLSSSTITDRTPAALTVSPDNKWTFDHIFDASTTTNLLVAHVAPNGTSITNSLGGQIFTGDATGTGLLTPVTIPMGRNATGGIVSLHPYLFYYGSAGIIGWSVAGDPTDLSSLGSGVARAWGQKIIKGLPLRSGGSGPSGVFWAYDAVIRATFTGGDTVFQFDVITSDSSIMSPDCVVDYDGVFYWVGVDRFLMFNGVVREIPNMMNLNWFFDGLNARQRSKVFAFKVTRYGEIWWCYPRGDATECTHAVIYNVREQSWYDTALPADGRTAGQFANAYAAPILVSAEQDGEVKVWVHEQGVDSIDGIGLFPILSFFETGDISAMLSGGTNNQLRISAIEPDFVQAGDMTAQVTGRANARAREVVGPVYTFPETADEPFQEIVMLKEQRRELRVRFSSNVLAGDYQMGLILAHIDTADGRVLT